MAKVLAVIVFIINLCRQFAKWFLTLSTLTTQNGFSVTVGNSIIK